MSPRSRKEYLETIHPRYRKARTREQKSQIITELCAVCKYHRKHAIRLLRKFRRFQKPKPKKRGRKSVYGHSDIIQALERIWLDSGMPCASRLIPVIALWMPSYPGGLTLHVIKALRKISESTAKRLLKPARNKHKRIRISTTKPGSLLRQHIPVKTNQWDIMIPGFVEADSVAHCGGSMLGQYTNTVNFVDIATTWTEQRAVWGKGETAVLEQVKDVESELPFELLGFDCDNGGEFLNQHLLRHFTERQRPIQFTRSRPYKKDDNAHIEQKNYTHVRQWLGYDRFDNPIIVDLLNDLYKNEWRLYFNFFVPSVKLIDKIRVRSKLIKKHDKPKTPYQRVMDASTEHVSSETKRNLKEQFESLNPFELKKTIDKKIAKILSLATKTVPCYKKSPG
jgi:hypothetical protein